MNDTHDGDKAGSTLTVKSVAGKEKLARNTPRIQNTLLLPASSWDNRIHQILNKVGLGFLGKNSPLFCQTSLATLGVFIGHGILRFYWHLFANSAD